MTQLHQEIDRTLLRSNTALNMVARNTHIPQKIIVTISRGGIVRDVAVHGGGARGKAMEAAYIRSFSNMKLSPFTPNIPGDLISFEFDLHTKSG